MKLSPARFTKHSPNKWQIKFGKWFPLTDMAGCSSYRSYSFSCYRTVGKVGKASQMADKCTPVEPVDCSVAVQPSARDRDLFCPG